MLQPKSIKSKKVKSPSSIEVRLEIRMLCRAAEEVGPEECLPDLLYLNVVVRRALFSDDPEPSGFDSFFGGQRKNGKV